MTAECWRWRPRWNQLPSTSCFGSSACLQSLSSVLCRAAYGLKSPQDRLGGTHAKAAAHPDKLTVCGRHWYYAGGTHCCLFCALNKLLLEIITVYPNEIAVKFENGTVLNTAHPDKLTVCGRHWYYAGGTHCCLFCALNKLLLEIITVYPNEIAVKFENGTVFFYRHL